MVREGEPNVTLKYISEQPSKLAISNFSDGTSCGFDNIIKGVKLCTIRSSSLLNCCSADISLYIVQVQGTNLRHYHAYILARAKAYRDTRLDWVREGRGRLKRQTVDKGLLRETEAVQSQIQALVKCDVGIVHINTPAKATCVADRCLAPQ